ncbi:DinB family protein [Dyadobacter sandarakinus]|uniref:DinB family protein n=1 Tax=Dyadobacter sandarakinus TaxID=2747268 RepID=A0ABX7I5I7_9BACT|nr:DinB family protein [Dyadobacter sandarakinus]QRR00468.1 DinB family protein [Dyadobacter sandarakinus]
MKPINQQYLLSQLARTLHQQTHMVNESFLDRDHDAMHAPSRSGGWSIVQCLAHLNSYSAYYLPRLEQQLSQPGIANATGMFRSSWLGRFFTNMMDPAQSKSRYKAHRLHVPGSDADAAEVTRAFIHHQETLLRCMDLCADKNLRKIRIPMSVAPMIKINAGDLIQFLIMHQERHIQQALRNLEKHTIA